MDENQDLKKLQRVELELLKEFDCFCRAHHLRYYAVAGTLIGAVRHKGFIPWDDDVDVAMPRPDYDRFFELYAREDHGRYSCVRVGDEGYSFAFGRLVDNRVKVTYHNYVKPFVSSIWIDIMQLDAAPDNPFVRKLFMLRILFNKLLIHLALFDSSVNLHREGRPLYERAIIALQLKFNIGRFFNAQKLLKKRETMLRRRPYGSTKTIVIANGLNKGRELYPCRCFGEGKSMPFEDMDVMVPDDFDGYLRPRYGDYMTPPAVGSRSGHELEVTYL